MKEYIKGDIIFETDFCRADERNVRRSQTKEFVEYVNRYLDNKALTRPLGEVIE